MDWVNLYLSHFLGQVYENDKPLEYSYTGDNRGKSMWTLDTGVIIIYCYVRIFYFCVKYIECMSNFFIKSTRIFFPFIKIFNFISEFGKQWSHRRYQVLKDPEGPGHVDILRNAY